MFSLETLEDCLVEGLEKVVDLWAKEATRDVLVSDVRKILSLKNL